MNISFYVVHTQRTRVHTRWILQHVVFGQRSTSFSYFSIGELNDGVLNTCMSILFNDLQTQQRKDWASSARAHNNVKHERGHKRTIWQIFTVDSQQKWLLYTKIEFFFLLDSQPLMRYLFCSSFRILPPSGGHYASFVPILHHSFLPQLLILLSFFE